MSWKGEKSSMVVLGVEGALLEQERGSPQIKGAATTRS